MLVRIAMLSLFGFMAGCTSSVTPPPTASTPPRESLPAVPATAAVPAPAPASANRPAPPPRTVTPPPVGSLSLTFFALTDDSRVVRNAAGRIDKVITPSGRSEVVLARMTLEEVDELVGRVDAAFRTGELYALSHIPAQQGDTVMPGPAAWEYLRSYLEPTDVIWSFGDVDMGLVAVRNNRLLAMVVVTSGTTRATRPSPPPGSQDGFARSPQRSPSATSL